MGFGGCTIREDDDDDVVGEGIRGTEVVGEKLGKRIPTRTLNDITRNDTKSAWLDEGEGVLTKKLRTLGSVGSSKQRLLFAHQDVYYFGRPSKVSAVVVLAGCLPTSFRAGRSAGGKRQEYRVVPGRRPTRLLPPPLPPPPSNASAFSTYVVTTAPQRHYKLHTTTSVMVTSATRQILRRVTTYPMRQSTPEL
ncbi:hypothetical protein M0802_000011 [Mischocyttarus mexicanus]|nr:hypothetical protein M0802_000011 [Mischocyttarus mexicanus]